MLSLMSVAMITIAVTKDLAQCSEDGSCKGAAMMQMTASDPPNPVAPLAGRIVTAKAEVTSLEDRTTACESLSGTKQGQVGASGGGGGAAVAATTVAPSIMQSEEKIVAMLTGGTMDVKTEIEGLEDRVAKVTARVLSLQKKVNGLIQKDESNAPHVTGVQLGTSHNDSPLAFKDRLVAIEENILNLRRDVEALEQTLSADPR